MIALTCQSAVASARRKWYAATAAASFLQHYLFLAGGGVHLACGTKEDEGGGSTFLGCFGFLASRLPRCCPLGI